MIKLFAMDMDGTVLNSRGEIDQRNIEAIRKLNESGVKTVLCSGRVATSLEHFNKVLGLDNPVIGNNGAIVKINEDKILSMHPLEDDNLKDLIDFSQEHKCVYHFYDEDTYYTNRFNPKGLQYLLIDNDYGYNTHCNLNVSKDPYADLKLKGHFGNKILIGNLGEHPYGRDKIVSMFEERFADYLYITSSSSTSIEIMEKGVTKWNGVLELINFLGINKDEIASIGDSYNDLPMLANAKLSFAMGNADETVKSHAKDVVAINDEFGVAEACEKILAYNKANPSV